MTNYQRWLRDVSRLLERAGWEVTINGHHKFKSPSGQVVTCSSSPKTEGTFRNVSRDLKRAGVLVDFKP